ncbi:MAG: hypothetical protein V5A64_07245 [Candidatus Thermoplasmatota archaeon]
MEKQKKHQKDDYQILAELKEIIEKQAKPKNLIDKYWENFDLQNSENPVEVFNAKKQCIKIGLEILRKNIEKSTDKLDNLFLESYKILKHQPKPYKQEIDDTKGGVPIKTISAEDTGSFATLASQQENGDDYIRDFRMQQHQLNLPALESVDNRIFHELVQRNIIRDKENPPPSEQFKRKLAEKMNR